MNVLTGMSAGAAGFFIAMAAAGAEEKPQAPPPEKSTQDLGAFIGKWRFVDEATEDAGFDYREEGTLHCFYAYEGAYVQCDGEGDNGRSKRTYSDFLNYNSITDQYEWVGVFANHPEKAFFVLTLSEDGRRVEMRGRPMNQRNGSTTLNYAVIEFDGEDSFVWNTYLNKSTDPGNHWPLSFIGTYERIE